MDVREIKLNMRYPESRQEDITDAFSRGYTGAVEIGNKAIKKLEAENAKLRELCWKFAEYTDQDRCLGCVVKRACRDGEVEECWQFTEIRELAHELGIKVNE